MWLLWTPGSRSREKPGMEANTEQKPQVQYNCRSFNPISEVWLIALLLLRGPAGRRHPRSADLAPSPAGRLAPMLTLLHAAIPGHASMIMPPSRNSIDAELPAWDHGKHPSTGWIEPYSCTCTNGTEAECNSGQSCFWFSQGCTIGCKACDGDGRRYPSYDHCPGTPSALKVPTYLDKKWWTANHNATPGSYEDIWRFNPWRAPGHAPVWDACGMAGGSPKEVFNAGAYNTTVHAEPPSLIFLTLTSHLSPSPQP